MPLWAKLPGVVRREDMSCQGKENLWSPRLAHAQNLLPIARGDATMWPTIEDAGVTQLVEYLLPKQAVVGSSPIARSAVSQQ